MARLHLRMPQTILFDYNQEQEKEFFHPAHGYIKRLMLFNYKDLKHMITGIFFDKENRHHHISSKKLIKLIKPAAFNVLFNTLKTISDRRVYIEALLTLLLSDGEEIVADKVSIATQTDFCDQVGIEPELSDQISIKPDQISIHTNLSDQVDIRKRKLPSLFGQNSQKGHGKVRVVSATELRNLNLQDHLNSNNIRAVVRLGNIIENGFEQGIHLNNNTQETTRNNVIHNENSNFEDSKEELIEDKSFSAMVTENSNIEDSKDNVFRDSSLSTVVTFDGSRIVLPVCAQDIFHLTAPDIMKCLTDENRQKLTVHQAYIDWKYCLRPNKHGFMLMHVAVLNNDIGLLKRQVAILKAKEVSIDIMARGMTPLHVAVIKNNLECTKILLDSGANPLLFSNNHRNALHLAALATPQVLQAVMIYVLKPALFSRSKHYKIQAPIIYRSRKDIYEVTDDFGYNAFMLACKNGKIENMATLFKYYPRILNKPMATTGNTAIMMVLADFLANVSTKKPGITEKSQLLTVCHLLTFDAALKCPNNYNITFGEMVRKINSVELRNFFTDVKNTKRIDMVRFERIWNLFVSSDHQNNIPRMYVNRYHTDINDALHEDLDDSVNIENDNLIVDRDGSFNTQSFAGQPRTIGSLETVSELLIKRPKKDRSRKKIAVQKTKRISENNDVSRVTGDKKTDLIVHDKEKIALNNLGKETNSRFTKKYANLRKRDTSNTAGSNDWVSNGNGSNFDTFTGNGSNFDTFTGNATNFDTFKGNGTNFDTFKGNASNFDTFKGNGTHFDTIKDGSNGKTTKKSDSESYRELYDLYNYLKLRSSQSESSDPLSTDKHIDKVASEELFNKNIPQIDIIEDNYGTTYIVENKIVEQSSKTNTGNVKHSNVDSFVHSNIKLKRKADLVSAKNISARGTPIQMRKVVAVNQT